MGCEQYTLSYQQEGLYLVCTRVCTGFCTKVYTMYRLFYYPIVVQKYKKIGIKESCVS